MRKHISLSTKEDSHNQNESKLIVKVLIINKSKKLNKKKDYWNY